MTATWHRVRWPLMALAIIALLAAMWAGLLRIGWSIPILRPTLPIAHGPLMVSGFLGTLISLERAVALGRRWTYIPPLLTGLGGLVLIAGLTGVAGPLLITLGSLGLVVVFAIIMRHQPALHTVTMEIGAVVWLIGNGLWLSGRPIYSIVLWWAGFLVLTIAGERLELSRLLRHSNVGRIVFLVIISLFLVGLVLAIPAFSTGSRLTGASMVALALWLLRYDIARRTVRQKGLTRFIAVSLLAGYVWLGIGGLLGFLFGGVIAGPHYDAVLHSVFLGFVFSMIFGHAPIIFPAIVGSKFTFRSTFYVHLALLHLSLLLRITGDLASWIPGRQWGGLLNVVALLLFLANTARGLHRPTYRT